MSLKSGVLPDELGHIFAMPNDAKHAVQRLPPPLPPQFISQDVCFGN